MMAEDHFRLIIAAVIDDGIMNTAKSCDKVAFYSVGKQDVVKPDH